MPLVKLYPTDNVCSRPRELIELYKHNRRWMRQWAALWYAARRCAFMPGGLPPMRLIDNLGLVVNMLQIDDQEAPDD